MSTVRRFDGIPRKRGKPFDTKKINRDLNWIRNIAKEQAGVAQRVAQLPRDKRSACPICKHPQFTPFFTVYSFRYSECGACGHLFVDELPNRETVKNLYSGEPEKQCCQSMVYLSEEIFNKRLDAISRPKVRFVAEHVRSRGLWVDIGCACGEMLLAAKELGFATRGIEADPAQVEFARGKNLDVIKDYLTADNSARYLENVEVLSCINVLEHIPDPLAFLQSIGRNVKQGTYAVVEVPRHPSITALANLAYPNTVYRGLTPPDHLHVYSERSLEILLEASGFVPIALWTFGQDATELLNQAVLNIPQPEAGAGVFSELLLGAAQALQAAVDEADLSDTLFLVAAKQA